jgi:MYXO-CTERM domain-containing protein
MRRRVCLLGPALSLCAMSVALPGSAQDGGTPDVPLVCGPDLTEHGACFGDVAAFCSAPNDSGQSATAPVRSTDCGALGARCFEQSAIGAWCLADDGATCALASDEGTAQLLCGDANQGPGPGCSLTDGCVTDAPACERDAPVTCAGRDLVLGCSEARQALILRCASTCEGDPPGCTAEPEGALCREGVAACAEGLACLGDGTFGYGRCAAPGPLASVDGGESTWAPEEPGGGCRCTSVPSSGGPALAALGVLVAAVYRRRRSALPGGVS